MDEQAKKFALRMIPYGLFGLGAGTGNEATISSVNWLTQASFAPPLVAVGVRKDSGAYALIQSERKFAVSVFASGQKDLAFAFFKHVTPEGGKIAGYGFETGATGAPILLDAPAWFECNVTEIVAGGDHAIVVGEVIGAGVRETRDALTLKECGVNYGG
ncbi:MAG: flavin reductase family protein [Chloroflexi bacterium]|nr:flavin reductase family protein [Chloroflexota bacterium]